mgnify:CR=1 FL=1
MTYQENYQKWLDFAELPAYLRDELVAMDEKTKEDAFYTNLEFGTAGMRGLIGAGTNRINIYVVRQATEGLTQKGKKLKNAELRLLTIAVTSLLSLLLNLLKFWLLMGSNLMYLKAYVQHLNCHLLFVTSTHLLGSW